MIDTGDWEPFVHVPLHTIPGDVAFLAPPRETALPQSCNFLAAARRRLCSAASLVRHAGQTSRVRASLACVLRLPNATRRAISDG